MNLISYDQYRIEGRFEKLNLRLLIRSRMFRRLFYFRKIQQSTGIAKCIYRWLNYNLSKKMSVELPHTVKLGKGALFIHPYGITFNSKAVVGDNFTILKGATIGNSKTGRVGSPIIGNNVYVGLNSTVVGGIKIGDNVMIAANTFVNFDVPDNSIVIGSPGIVHHKDKASQPYINNSIEDYI